MFITLHCSWDDEQLLTFQELYMELKVVPIAEQLSRTHSPSTAVTTRGGDLIISPGSLQTRGSKE